MKLPFAKIWDRACARSAILARFDDWLCERSPSPTRQVLDKHWYWAQRFHRRRWLMTVFLVGPNGQCGRLTRTRERYLLLDLPTKGTYGKVPRRRGPLLLHWGSLTAAKLPLTPEQDADLASRLLAFDDIRLARPSAQELTVVAATKAVAG